MAKQAKKSGKPRALELEEDEISELEAPPEPTMSQFVEEMFPTTEAELQEAPMGQLPTLGFIKAKFKTKSAAIRYLNTRGIAVKEIAKFLGFRYQHVRNVLKNELKRGPNEDFTIKPDSPTALGVVTPVGGGTIVSSLAGISPPEPEEDV